MVLEVAELCFSAAAKCPESSPKATAPLYFTGRLKDNCFVSLSNLALECRSGDRLQL
jgi:hypothetical protein